MANRLVKLVSFCSLLLAASNLWFKHNQLLHSVAFNSSTLDHPFLTKDRSQGAQGHVAKLTTTKSSKEASVDPQKRFCELGTDRSMATVFDECFKLLHPILNMPDDKSNNGYVKLATDPVPHNWLLFGDSTMKLVVDSANWCATIVKLKNHDDRCDKCPFLTSTESISIEKWKKPNAKRGEGPSRFGLNNPTCADSSTSSFRVMTKKTHPELGQIRYFPVEYARDVETQCPAVGINTTQEAVEYYLTHNYPPQVYRNTTTCLMSVGFHDMGIRPEIRMSTYVQNVKHYIRRIRPFCKTMVWMGMNTVRGDNLRPQTNAKVVQWNKGVQDMLVKTYPDDVVFMDVTSCTRSKAAHFDNVHMKKPYYKDLSNFFFQNLTTFCNPA